MSFFSDEDEVSNTGGGAGKAMTPTAKSETKFKSKYDFESSSCDEDEDGCDCLICGDKFIRNDKDKMNNYIKLKCGHEFHYTCINDYFKVLNCKKTYKEMGTNLKRECPMCRVSSPLIQVKMNVDYIKGIHRAPRKSNTTSDKSISSKIILSTEPTQCKGICKTGKQCKKKGNDKYHGYCHIHKDQYIE